MRKQLAIGLSLLALTGFGNANQFGVSFNSQDATSKYTHLEEASLNQTFEPMSRASLEIGLPYRFSFQTASVQFITGGGNLDFGNMDFTDPTIEQCQKDGYSLTNCGSGQLQGLKCPYNSAYFDKCCDSRYKYDKSACSYPNTVSGDTCGGKYKCYCDRNEFPYEECVSPQVSTGSSCTEEGKTYYSQCECPSNYDKLCDQRFQSGVGTGCVKNNKTYYTQCSCPADFNLTCEEWGPANPSYYCLLDGVKYYNNCNTCSFSCSLDSCPANTICSYEDCSQKYCATGCATNYVNWCAKPQTDCVTLGYTKTKSECSSDYLVCPSDSSAVFCKS